MAQVPIYFCMPLIGRSAAKDWQKVCRLLDQTLHSILSQPGDVRVFIACNEVPETSFGDDKRVRFLVMESPPPANITEMRRDTRSKRARVIDEVVASGGGYVVRVDADDLISNRLTRHIVADDNRVGYLFKRGYTYNVATKEFRLSRSFDRLAAPAASYSWVRTIWARNPFPERSPGAAIPNSGNAAGQSAGRLPRSPSRLRST